MLHYSASLRFPFSNDCYAEIVRNTRRRVGMPPESLQCNGLLWVPSREKPSFPVGNYPFATDRFCFLALCGITNNSDAFCSPFTNSLLPLLLFGESRFDFLNHKIHVNGFRALLKAAC